MMRATRTVCVAGGCLVLCACNSSGPHRGEGWTKSDDDHSALLALAKARFFQAWTKKADVQFNPAGISNAVVNSPDFLSFDGMSQGKTVIVGAADYVSIWGPGMNGFKTASLTEAKALRSWTCDDGAATASIVRVQGEMQDGKTLDVLGHMTLVWKWEGGGWRVMHEHMSLGVRE